MTTRIMVIHTAGYYELDYTYFIINVLCSYRNRVVPIGYQRDRRGNFCANADGQIVPLIPALPISD